MVKPRDIYRTRPIVFYEPSTCAGSPNGVDHKKGRLPGEDCRCDHSKSSWLMTIGVLPNDGLMHWGGS